MKFLEALVKQRYSIIATLFMIGWVIRHNLSDLVFIGVFVIADAIVSLKD